MIVFGKCLRYQTLEHLPMQSLLRRIDFVFLECWNIAAVKLLNSSQTLAMQTHKHLQNGVSQSEPLICKSGIVFIVKVASNRCRISKRLLKTSLPQEENPIIIGYCKIWIQILVMNVQRYTSLKPAKWRKMQRFWKFKALDWNYLNFTTASLPVQNQISV